MKKANSRSICDELLERFMAALGVRDSAAMDARMYFAHLRARFGPPAAGAG